MTLWGAQGASYFGSYGFSMSPPDRIQLGDADLRRDCAAEAWALSGIWLMPA
jgi:hypothetical protein